MANLTISDLKIVRSVTDLNYQNQKQVQGGSGINQADLDWYRKNKDNMAIFWGNIAPGEFRIEILVDNSGNNSNTATVID